MQRLSYILIALILGFTPNQGQAQDAIYTVAGDVSSPQSYRYLSRQQVYLRDLLNDAGYNNAAGIARILRGTPLRTVTTDSVSPEITGSGSLLFPNDVVVFRSFDGHCPGRQNALAMFSDGPVVLQIPGNGYPVWQLLEAIQLPHEGRISVTRTRQGSESEVRMSGQEFIQHGDIINLGGITQTAGLRISQHSPTAPGFGKECVSGMQLARNQQHAVQTAYETSTLNGERLGVVHENSQTMPSMRPQDLPKTTGSEIQMVQYLKDDTVPAEISENGAKKPRLLKRFLNKFKGKSSDKGNESATAAGIGQPSISAVPTPPPIVYESGNRFPPFIPVEKASVFIKNEDKEGAAQSTSTISIPPVDSDPATDNLTPNEFLSRTDAGQMLLRTGNTGQTEDTAANGPFRMASLQIPSDDAVPQSLASTAMPNQQNEARNSGWNAIFLTGLAVAAGLIVFGWLKTKREQASVRQFDGGLHDPRFPAAEKQTKTAAATRLAVPVASEQNSQTWHQAVEVSERAEDFAVSVISGDCPVLSAGIDDYETVDTESLVAASPSPASETVSADNIVESHENTTVDTTDSEIQTSERFESQWLNEDSKDSQQVLSESDDAGSAVRTPNVEPVATAKDISQCNEAFSDLEDLLQNRLPFDIKQADLPLRIALFGSPAGPRRLRVDAAHTQTAPPHIMTSARQEQKSRPAATTASVSDRDDAGNQPAADTAANADHDRFDHALDFLEEQSES
ncbi:MAG: hypothetical protein ABGZ23_10800 [Fuerstiella sp.]